MKQEDEGIARVLRLKKEQERQRKEDKRELVTYKNRVLNLVSALVQNKHQSGVAIPLFVALADVNQNTDVGARASNEP